jgi:DNA polymerase-3 subunit epsilon
MTISSSKCQSKKKKRPNKATCHKPIKNLEQGMVDLNKTWQELSFVALDTETTGKYPLESEICEVAAVKWHGGAIVGEYQTLVRPTHQMSEEVIKIHNISNEMVMTAPEIGEILPAFSTFIKGSICIAHHAPFDLGFLAPEFESRHLPLPLESALCTSLLSRKLIRESSNHKLQTLIRVLKLDGGQAHRALDDTKACLQVALECFRRLGEDAPLAKILQTQGGALMWSQYSIETLLEMSKFQHIVRAIKDKREVSLVYEGGSRPGRARVVEPIGIVRGPNGDFLVATEDGELPPKRYLLEKITEAKIR